ncbi:hypothetical protein PM082_006273 [Marasmius tenuissimus]|nr:hypothetical protein PM082_006273 [Marasmius tenuissimus]
MSSRGAKKPIYILGLGPGMVQRAEEGSWGDVGGSGGEVGGLMVVVDGQEGMRLRPMAACASWHRRYVVIDHHDDGDGLYVVWGRPNYKFK